MKNFNLFKVLCLLVVLTHNNIQANEEKLPNENRTELNINRLHSELLSIQQAWAHTQYTLTDDAQLEGFKILLKKALIFTQNFPDNAESWAWQGIIQSSYAGAEGGLGALSWAKKAKQSFEKSLEIDDEALQGSAYTSLGVLYHKVPGWPIGFGDDDQAKLLLEKGLKINDKGIDANYFYGEFLYDEGDDQVAVEYLQRAQSAIPRPNRPLADEGRQREIKILLDKISQ